MGRRTEDIVHTAIVLAGELKSRDNEIIGEIRLVGVLGGAAQKIRMADPSLQQRLQTASLHAVLPSGIVFLFPGRQALD
jgi:hypothetical protein